jgi:putative membrane protein insertion efficiency factor
MVNPRVHVVPLLIFAFLIAGFSPLHPDDRSNLRLILDNRNNPGLSPAAGKSRLDLTDSTSELKMAGLVLLRLYQVALSSQDGPRCMFHPSCSEYAKQALVEHGAVIGSLMAVDRYLRCNGVDRDLYPYDPMLRKLLDPVPEKTAREGWD